MRQALAWTRRGFLLGGGAALLAPAASALSPLPELKIESRSLDIEGKAAKVYQILNSEGGSGHVLMAGENFRLRVVNGIAEPALLHWHGLTPPNAQDGVPGPIQAPLPPGGFADYDFPVALPGTNWMHSHLGLQEQKLMAAPLIVRDRADAARDAAEIVVMLHDFAFAEPEAILAKLAHGMHMDGMDMSGMDHGSMNMGAMDINDVEFDAYLANDRTLSDPEIHSLAPDTNVYLRIINGASATNFMIDLGAKIGALVAVDGRPVEPLHARRFPLAIAQRADIELRIGAEALPILFQREGDRRRTGIILVGGKAPVTRISALADEPAPLMSALPGRILKSLSPLAFDAGAPRRLLRFDLKGSMMDYRWSVENSAAPGKPALVKAGEIVEMDVVNNMSMSHPMHLHGHHFEIVAIDGEPVAGALRDTELIPPGGSARLRFIANNPGRWLFHCHNLYHMQAGMMAEIHYEG